MMATAYRHIEAYVRPGQRLDLPRAVIAAVEADALHIADLLDSHGFATAVGSEGEGEVGQFPSGQS